MNIKVDLDIMEYINASSKHKEILTGIISQSATLPTADQDGNHFISVEEAFGEHFTEFYNKFDKMSIKVNSDEFQTSHEDIEREIKQLQSSVQGCALKIANGRIVIVGQQPSVKKVNAKMSQKLQELKEEFTKKQEEKEFFPLPPEKIRLLDHSSSWDEIRKQHMVQVEVQSGGLMITGQENKIEKAKMFLLMKVMNACSRTMKISRGNCNLLRTKSGVDKVYAYLKSCSINAVITVIPDRCEVSITSLSTGEADNAVSALQNAMPDKEIPLDEGTQKLVQSDKGSSFIRELEQCYCVEIQKIDGNLSNLSIVGIDVTEAHEELIEFLNDNAVYKKFITISMGLIRFIFQHCKDHLKDIKESLQKELVTIEQSDGAILITGTQLGLWTAVEQIEEVYGKVKKDKIIYQRPGVRKLFQKGFIKDVLCGVENELSLIIINELEDVQASIEEVNPIKHKLENDDGQNRLISSFKTQVGKKICVYQGDLTKHKVDVIVNAANNQLFLVGGVAGAILRAGGEVIQNGCDEHIRKYGDLADGDVAITGAGKINCQRIVHAMGPRWQNAVSYIGERELHLKQKMAKEALNLALENTLNAVQQYQSVAIPAVSSGLFGFPKDLCANILVSAALKFCKAVPWSTLREIHFINNDVPTVKAFEQEFERRFKSQAGYKIEAPLLADTSSTRTNWWNDEVKKPQTFITGKPLGTKKKDEGVAPAPRNTDDSTTLRTPEGIAIDLVIGDLSKQKVCF